MIRNLLLFALCCSAFTASASTIIVNSLNDDADCSLRNAILAANTDTAVAGCALRGVVHENFDQIQIAVSGTYSPTSPLPAVTDAVQMDATLGTFVLDGTAAGATTNGLQLEAYAMVRGFVIQNFGGSGIVAHGGLTVSGCRIGTDAAGLKAAPNCTGVGSAGAGILLESVGVAPRTSLVLSGWIGGSSVAERNVISGNQCDGVVFRSTPGYLMYGEIAGNYIGADSCGCDVIPNSGYGVVLEGGGDHQAYDVTVGEMGGLGKACDGCNVIAGNPLGQIHISGGIGRVYVNVIGANANMTAALPAAAGAPTGAGVLVDGTGEALMSGDVIVGSSDAAIRVERSGRLLLQYSRIGATVQGTIIPNGIGILLRGSAPVVVEASSIVASAGAGIVIDGGSNSVIRGNNIGALGGSSLTPAGNGGGGIVIANGASHNIIGGADQPNTIAYNTIIGHGPAISVTSGVSNTISQNSIYENHGTLSSLAIDLGADGPTPNDPCDSDSGPNNLQNVPVLTIATRAGVSACGNGCTGTRIFGTLAGQANTQYKLEFFTNPAGSGMPEKTQRYLGSANVTTDASCNATFVAETSGAAIANGNVVATATSPTGDTSEVSAPVAVWSGQTDPRYDSNADGFADILLRNHSTGFNTSWLLDGSQNVWAMQNMPALPNTDYQIESSFYLGGQGDNRNILWRNYVTGANAIWTMDASVSAPLAIIDLQALPNTQYYVGGTADFNGDGFTDILWRNNTTGAVAIWLMNGTTYTGTIDLPGVPIPDWTIAGTGDFNDDGRADILWHNTSTGANAIWFMDGTTYVSTLNIQSIPNTAYVPVAIADYNGDHHVDIVWHNTTTGANAIWLMNGTTLGTIANLPTVPNTSIVPVGPK